jgi:hypothetical protein
MPAGLPSATSTTIPQGNHRGTLARQDDARDPGAAAQPQLAKRGGGLAAVSGLRDGNSRQVPSILFKA